MTTTKVGIELEVRSAKAEDNAKRLAGELGKVKKEAEGAGAATGPKGLSGSFDATAGKAALAATAVTALAFAADKASARSLSLQAVQSALAISIDKSRDSTMGLVGDMELMQAANNAVRLGVVKNEEEFAKLAGIATKLGLSVGQDATSAVADLTTALARQSPQILDNLGLQVDLNKAHETYAAKLGKSASALTEAEKKQAFINAALEEGTKQANSFNLKIDSGAMSLQQFKVALINTADDGFKAFTGALAQAQSAFSDFMENVADFEAYEKARVGGISRENMDASYRRVTQRGMAGVAGAKGEAARLEIESLRRRDEAAKATLDTQVQMNRDMETSISMLEANALANDKVTESLNRRKRAGGGATGDPYAAERSEFNSQLLSSQMAGAGGQLGAAQDRDAFNDQLGDAKMAKAGMDAKKAQDAFAEEMAEKSKERAKAEADAIKKAEEEKQKAIERTMRSQMRVASITAHMTSQATQLADVAADGFIKSEKRKDQVRKGIAGSEMIIIGITETVKAVAAFAGFNYVEGAMHVAAAALAYAKGGMLLGQAGGAGGGMSVGGGGGFGGAAFGGGTDTGGSPQSSTGGGSRPTSNGPVSEAEESVQRSGRGGRPGPTRNRDRDGGGPTIQLFHLGDVNESSAIKLSQALRRVERKAGNVNS